MKKIVCRHVGYDLQYQRPVCGRLHAYRRLRTFSKTVVVPHKVRNTTHPLLERNKTHPLEKLQSVLAVLEHKLREAAGHLHYSADLVVVRHPRKYRESQKHLYRDATERPDVNGPVIRQA